MSTITPWTLHTPTVVFGLSKNNVKTFSNADTFNSDYRETQNHFST